MREVEARVWLSNKETFRQYAIDKLAIMHSLNLPVPDQINLLIRGVMPVLLLTVFDSERI